MMLSAMIPWVSVVLAFFLLGIATLSYTIVKRRSLANHLVVIGTLTPGRNKGYAMVTWTSRGTQYTSSPFHVWTFRKSHIRLLIDPAYDTTYVVDHWTLNYKWGYVLSAVLFGISLTLLAVLYMTH